MPKRNFWDDFWYSAGKAVPQGTKIGSDSYLERLSRESRESMVDKVHFLEQEENRKTREFQAGEAEKTRAFTEAEAEKARKTDKSRTLDERYMDAVSKPSAERTPEDKEIIQDWRAKNIAEKEKSERAFNKEEAVYRILSKSESERSEGEKEYLKYATKEGETKRTSGEAAKSYDIEREQAIGADLAIVKDLEKNHPQIMIADRKQITDSASRNAIDKYDAAKQRIQAYDQQHQFLPSVDSAKAGVGRFGTQEYDASQTAGQILSPDEQKLIDADNGTLSDEELARKEALLLRLIGKK